MTTGDNQPVDGRSSSSASAEPALAREHRSQPREPATSRVLEIDAVRALVVVGVVLNHSVDGLVHAGLLGTSSVLAEVNALLHVVRMPALALVVGVFIPDGVSRWGVHGYLTRRVGLFVYLYLLWFYLQSAIELATNRVKNRARAPGDLLTPWLTFAHLWFLPFLAIATVVVVLCRPWRSWSVGAVCLAGAATLSFLTWGWNPRGFGLQGLSLVVFVMAGACIGLFRLRRLLSWRNPLGWAIFGTVGAGIAIGLFNDGVTSATDGVARTPVAQAATSVAIAIGGIVAIFAVAVLLGRASGAFARVIVVVGSRTLQIFLAHVVVVAGTRVVLVSVGVSEPYWIAAASLVLGVVLPLLFAGWSETRRPWRWLFAVPSRVALDQDGRHFAWR